jgi:hypothetical protein
MATLKVMGLAVTPRDVALITDVVEGVIATLGESAASKAREAGLAAAAKITTADEAEAAASERT